MSKQTLYRTEAFRDQWRKYFKTLRTRQSLSQSQLAAKSNISASTICSIEQVGWIPSFEVVYTLGDALGFRDNLLLAAGYVPKQYKLRDLFSILNLPPE
jgi:transcriptional regulator with XRE-family HTH domain